MGSGTLAEVNNVLRPFWRCFKEALQAHSQLSLVSRQALPGEGSLGRARPWRNPLCSRGWRQDRSLQHIFPLSHLLCLFLHLLFPSRCRAAPSTPSLCCILFPSPLFSFPWKGRWDLDAISLLIHITLPFCAVLCACAPFPRTRVLHEKRC